MLTIIGCVIGYLVMAVVTFSYNAWLVRDLPMVRDHVIIRNFVLWPIFLPLLAYAHWRKGS